MFNRYTIIGLLLSVIGFFLIPFIIGIFIMAAGWMLATFGVFYYFVNIFPAGRKAMAYVKALLIKYFGWYKTVFTEAFGNNKNEN
jgi:hypothetical protein